MAIFEQTSLRAHKRAQIPSELANIAGLTWLNFMLGLAILMAALLIGPRVVPADQQPTCIGNVELPGPFGFGMNCDSPQFLWLAREPAALLEQNNERQTRPGFVIAAAALNDLISQFIKPGGTPQRIGTGFLDPKLITQAFARDLPAYLAYILLNVALLLTSFHFWRKLIEPRMSHGAAIGTVVVASGLLLVTNDVVKAFVWSPHTQMFNILVPLIALYATLRTWQGAILDRRFMLAMGVITGLGATAYPVFVVIPACLIPIALISARWRASGNLALLLALSIAPSALWYAYVVWQTGSYYQEEMAQGEVVWMMEALSKGYGNFIAEWFGTLGTFLMMAAPQALPLVVLLAWVTVAAIIDRRARERLPSLMPMALAALYVSLAVLCFYTCVGWTATRLAYPILPPLLAAAAAGAVVVASHMDRSRRTVFAVGCVGILAVQMVYLVVKDGPWS
jgi:hypothetical protein